jgi:hypothetical protein
VITLYAQVDDEGRLGFVSRWHGRLEARVTGEERRELEGLLDRVCQGVWGVMRRDLVEGVH